jgi:hypothetical protein
MSTTLTLSETAQKHGVAKSSLSEAVHDGRPVQDMNLHRYAIIENGRIQEFEFPSWYRFPSGEGGKEKEEEETVYMTMAELCQEHSEFDRFRIETALRNEWPIDGFPVSEWVVRDDEGKWDGFEVPRSADFDGPHRQNVSSTNEDAESGEKDGAQEGRANETALRGGEKSSSETTQRKASPNAAGGLGALLGAAMFKWVTS